MSRHNGFDTPGFAPRARIEVFSGEVNSPDNQFRLCPPRDMDEPHKQTDTGKPHGQAVRAGSGVLRRPMSCSAQRFSQPRHGRGQMARLELSPHPPVAVVPAAARGRRSIHAGALPPPVLIRSVKIQKMITFCFGVLV